MRALQADGIVTLSSAVHWLGLCVVVLRMVPISALCHVARPTWCPSPSKLLTESLPRPCAHIPGSEKGWECWLL